MPASAKARASRCTVRSLTSRSSASSAPVSSPRTWSCRSRLIIRAARTTSLSPIIPTLAVGNMVHAGVMDIDTSTITLNTVSGPAAAYVASPAGGDGSGVLVLHAWWGLNDDFKRWCDDLAREGFTALAPDLRAGRVVDSIDEANAMRADFTAEQLRPIVE